MNVKMTLLDFLAYHAGGAMLSNLHGLDYLGRNRLISLLEEIRPEDAALKEWNDALDYLAGVPAERTASAAKEKLLELLSRQSD